MQEVARVLRPGGLFVSYEWSPYPAFDSSYPKVDAPASARLHAAVNAALAGRGLHPLASSIPNILAGVDAFTDISPKVYYVPIGAWPANDTMRHIGKECRMAQEKYASSVTPLLIEAGLKEDEVGKLVADYISEINSVRGLVRVLHTVHARRV